VKLVDRFTTLRLLLCGSVFMGFTVPPINPATQWAVAHVLYGICGLMWRKHIISV
jgi:hypothetical protein